MISRRTLLKALPFTPFARLCAADGQPNLLDRGYIELYHLRFAEGRRLFQEFEQQNPSNPMGPASVGASYLFEEFESHSVLTSEFFLDDDLLLDGIKGKPNETRMKAFQTAATRAQRIADDAVFKNRNDADALLAGTIVLGMRANAAVLIYKEKLDALKYTKEGEEWGRRLLSIAPGQKDGYMALGAASYIIACLPFYKRALVRLGGIKGDRKVGMDLLSETARNGRFLRPYAKILLALACLRELQPARARLLLGELVTEFPQSPLFRREFDKFTLKLK